MCAPSPRRESLREWTAPSILSDADHIITLCVSITMSLLRIITIITYYYVFQARQLAAVLETKKM